MSVRKREWTTAKGERKSAWVVAYSDQAGKRHLKTFPRKKEADAFEARASVEVSEGIHTASRQSVRVHDAGELWIATAEKNKLERSTVAQYRQHLRLHIVPLLGALRLSDLSAPLVRDFEDKLRKGVGLPGTRDVQPRSPALTRKVLVSLSSLLADAQERGLVARNVVRELRAKRSVGKERRADRRLKGKLKVGVDIPTRQEIKAIVGALQGRRRPLLLTAIFCGLRASELRGLRWVDVDLKRAELHVRQRADRYNKIGPPKSEAGERTVPLSPMVVKALREWKLACPVSKLDLMFPTRTGAIEHHSNIVATALGPPQISAGVIAMRRNKDGSPMLDENGAQVLGPKYTGLHALRHFYASWCINRRVDGGLELPPKLVQERLGHSSIAMTLDVYGHLFPRTEDGSEMAAAEAALLA